MIVPLFLLCAENNNKKEEKLTQYPHAIVFIWLYIFDEDYE
jgi:hypothetical protein